MSTLFATVPVRFLPGRHDEFLALEPVVRRHARVAFRDRYGEEREEAEAEAVAAAFESFVALKKRGVDAAAFPSALAIYAVLHVKDGRHVGGRSSSRDVLSPKARQRRHFHVFSLETVGNALTEHLADGGQTPVPDQVAARLDIPAFLQTLSERDRNLALQLADGHQANHVAARAGISPARLTQLRRQWFRVWRHFIGEVHDGQIKTGLTASPSLERR